MSQQGRNCVVDRRIAYPMIVLQKKADLFISLCQVVDQCRHDRLWADQRGLEHETDCVTAHPVTGAL